MKRARTKPPRWVQVAYLPKPEKDQSVKAMAAHDLALASIRALVKIGKTVRVEQAYADGLRFFARRG